MDPVTLSILGGVALLSLGGGFLAGRRSRGVSDSQIMNVAEIIQELEEKEELEEELAEA